MKDNLKSHNQKKNLIKEEINFWEKKYAELSKNNSRYSGISDDRLYPREKFLISKIRTYIKKDTRVLEIGAGGFKTIRTLLDPDEYRYFYVGSDISINALHIGKQEIKTGAFVQCNVEKLPFLPGSFDIILSFGVLHHTSNLEDNIPELIKVLRRNGLLILHEPVGMSNCNNSSFIKKYVKNWLSKSNDKISPMQNKLNEIRLFQHLKSNTRIIAIKREYSPIRLILIKLFRNLIPRSITLLKFILLLDDITIFLAELLDIKILKYGGLMLIAQKT